MFKSVLYFGMAILMATAACKREKTNEESGDFDRSEVTGLAKKGSAAAPVAPPTNYPEVQKLLNNFWVFEHYLIPTGQDSYVKHRINKGIWFQFHSDGTYISGKWEETLDEGTYFVKEVGNPYMGKNMRNIYLDSAIDDNRDVEWQVQGMTPDGSYMSWVKITNNSVDQTPGMTKVIQMMMMPTPAALDVDSLGNPLH